MDAAPQPRSLRAAAAVLLAVSAASAGLAFAFAPRAHVTAGRLDTSGGVRTRGAEPVVRNVEFEWPRELREDEPATLTLRFRDPACAAKGGTPAADTRGAAAVELGEDELFVSLVATGFSYTGGPKRILLRRCEQSIGWDVMPERAPQHRLAFRFETSIGDVAVTPSRFDVPVSGALLLSSATLYHGASAFSVVTALLGMGGAVGVLRKWTGGLFGLIRRAKV